MQAVVMPFGFYPVTVTGQSTPACTLRYSKRSFKHGKMFVAAKSSNMTAAGVIPQGLNNIRSWLSNSGIEVLEKWPGSSPDLNPIENCWAVFKKRVAQRKPTSLNGLKKTTAEVWATEIGEEYCKNLIESMPLRIQAVLKARGGPTKY